MLNQEWIAQGFYVSELDSNGIPFYQLLRKDLFGDYKIVAGSRNAEDMNPLAESVWNRMIALRAYQEDDGEVE